MMKRKFLVDSHLAKLARWLRMLGYDAEIKPDPQAPLGEFVWQARMNNRVALTVRRHVPRDLKNDLVVLSHGTIADQLRELKRFNLISIPESIDLAESRCSICNAPLKQLSTKNPSDRPILLGHPELKPGTLKRYNDFFSCTNPRCGKLYWEGAHWCRIKQVLESL